MNRTMTMVRAGGLLIEAEAVIAITQGENDVNDADDTPTDRYLRFFLETGNSFQWAADNMEEADRVMKEIEAAKRGTPAPHEWCVTYNERTFQPDNSWKVEKKSVTVAALSSEAAKETARAELPGNTMTRQFEIDSVVLLSDY